MKQISDRQTNKKKAPQRNRIRLYKPCHRESRMTWAPRMSARAAVEGRGVGPDHPVGWLGEVGEGFVGRLRTFTNYTRTGRR